MLISWFIAAFAFANPVSVRAISSVFGLRLPGAVAISSHRAVVPGSSAVYRGAAVISKGISPIRRLTAPSFSGHCNEILVAFSGDSSDTDEVWSELQLLASEYSSTHNAPISPYIVANLCRKLITSRRRSDISGVLVAGLHPPRGGGTPHVPVLYSIDDWGTLTECESAAVGPDAPLLLGLLDKGLSVYASKGKETIQPENKPHPSSLSEVDGEKYGLKVINDCWRVLKSSSAGHIGPIDVAVISRDRGLTWCVL
jgi:20S proteasome alpha/beta subunit